MRYARYPASGVRDAAPGCETSCRSIPVDGRDALGMRPPGCCLSPCDGAPFQGMARLGTAAAHSAPGRRGIARVREPRRDTPWTTASNHHPPRGTSPGSADTAPSHAANGYGARHPVRRVRDAAPSKPGDGRGALGTRPAWALSES